MARIHADALAAGDMDAIRWCQAAARLIAIGARSGVQPAEPPVRAAVQLDMF